jgi:phosphatidylethanolamine-binding protein (PEBP) family uncharacterized protein
MEIYYNNNRLINNDFLTPSETQIKPEVKFNLNSDKYSTLVMYDPDAVVGTFVHWLVTNIKDNNIDDSTILIPYKGPEPPPKSGKHRYIFELYMQNNKINTEPLQQRSISINVIRNLLGITNYISKIKFISQNERGGKNKKTKKHRKIKNLKGKKSKKQRKY